jgi:flagellar biosynthesis/type III secretory pathway chaperone
MEKKKVKVVEYSNHPEMEGDELKVVIMNNEKIEPRMKKTIIPRIPKQPRMTIDQLAKIVLDGFATVNQRIDKIEETLQRHEEILMRHEQILNKHTEILERHEEILMRHEEIFKRNNLK